MTTPIYGGKTADERPKSDTPLALWLRDNGVSKYAFAKMVGCDPKMVVWWATGRSIPNLIYAFKIDQATEGGVPPASWLGTEYGRLAWNSTGRDWAKYEAQRRVCEARYNAKKKAKRLDSSGGAA